MTVVTDKPVTIDCLFVSSNSAENIRRLIVLDRSKDPRGEYSAEALRAATLRAIDEGCYRAEKIGDAWNFTPQQSPYDPSH